MRASRVLARPRLLRDTDADADADATGEDHDPPLPPLHAVGRLRQEGGEELVPLAQRKVGGRRDAVGVGAAARGHDGRRGAKLRDARLPRAVPPVDGAAGGFDERAPVESRSDLTVLRRVAAQPRVSGVHQRRLAAGGG